MLRTAALPEQVTGHQPEIPAWLRDPAAFAAVRASAPNNRRPHPRHADITRGFEAWLPRWPEPAAPDGETQDPTVMRLESGARELRVTSRPRSGHCVGVDCVQDVLNQLQGDGATLLWTRPLRLPAGDATESLLATRERAIWIVSLPLGARLFRVSLSSPFEEFEAALSEAGRVPHLLFPLDGVQPAYAAEALRNAAPKLDDRLRLRVRAAMAAAPPATPRCPLQAILAPIGDRATHASILLDAYVSTSDVERRRGLVHCAAARSKAAERIAVLALVEDDAALHAFGAAAVAAHPERALADGRILFYQGQALADPQHGQRDLVARGLIELLEAMPAQRRRAMVDDLLAHPQPREQIMGWAILHAHPEILDTEYLHHLVARATPDTALRALDLLDDPPRAPRLEVLRVRADATRGGDERESDLLIALANTIASFADARDTARLKAVFERALLAAKGKARDRVRRHFEALILAHRWAAAGQTEAPDRPTAARAFFDAGRRVRAARGQSDGAPRPASALRSLALPQLLRGTDWLYARVANPRAVAAAGKALLARVTPLQRADTGLVRAIAQSMWLDSGAELFAEDSGLDLSHPIECATNPDVGGEVCVARVSDADRLLSKLALREFGNDSALVLPINLLDIGTVPVVLGSAPTLVHHRIYASEPEAPESEVLVKERARAVDRWFGFELHRHSIIEARVDNVAVDSEWYLVVGDRLFVFTTERMAKHVLTTGGAALADHPQFAALSRDWDGSEAIAALALGRGSPLGMPGSLQLAVDGNGIRFRYQGTPQRAEATTAVGALLPPGAVSTVVFSRGRYDGKLRLDEGDPGDDRLRVPPPALMASEGAGALAWYPRAGESVWQDWLIALEPTARDRKRLKAAGLWPRRDREIKRAGRLSVARHGEYLVVGASHARLREVLSRPTPPGSRVLTAGLFAGEPASRAIAGFVGADRDDRDFLAAIAGLVTRAHFDARAIGDKVVMTGGLELRTTKGHEPPDVVDALLATRDVRNALRLPRAVTDEQVTSPLTFIFTTDDPQTVTTRVFGDSARIRTAIEGDRVRVTVSPRAVGSDVQLTAGQRAAALRSERQYPTKDPRITKIIGSVVGDASKPHDVAARVVTWVNNRLRYEITPKHLNGGEILDAGRGDCSEYTTLTVTLLRAAGIPAEKRSGMLASGTDMVAHAWVAYHDGTSWREIDPTNGQLEVDSGHIEMSLLEAMALHAVGSFELTAIEAGK